MKSALMPVFGKNLCYLGAFEVTLVCFGLLLGVCFFSSSLGNSILLHPITLPKLHHTPSVFYISTTLCLGSGSFYEMCMLCSEFLDF